MRARASARRKPSKLETFAMIAITVVAVTGVFGTLGTIAAFNYFAGDLPSLDALQSANLEQTTRIYDSSGKVLLDTVYHENRTILQPSQIADTLKKATVDTEDRSFYSNHGV